ncbi:phosphatase PAP2 family protein [Pseudooceanicola sp.]|uniref:phosphatase PAP2 family protein n=1 Tax=Pseudooceanicola sp. TaxID=1914328 RepID=UPI0040583344
MRPHPRLTALFARLEIATLFALVVLAGALWAFVALASEIAEGDLHAFDEAILMALRTAGDPSDPIGGHGVEIAMRDLTALGGVTVITLIASVVVIYLALQRHAASAVFLAGAIIGGSLLSTVAKLAFDRPRPELVPHGVEVVTASFPSGHSMMAAVTYLTLAVMLSRNEHQFRLKVFHFAVAVLMTFLVGASRVYLGVHWPSDVLAGWALGAAWALGVAMVAQTLGRRGRIDPAQGDDA